MEPLGGRVWFAGEAVHATKWGTVAGAWESGERAAEAVLRQSARARSGSRRSRSGVRAVHAGGAH